MKLKKLVIRFMQILILILVVLIIAYLGVNIYVNKTALKYMSTVDEVDSKQAIIVLGARVFKSGNLSPMLQDRVDTAVEIYKKGKVKKILMSGDHGQQSYDEVNAMKKYAIKKGVLERDVFMDHAGFSTYESIYRAKYIFGLDNISITTQEYHLKRAIFIARVFKMDVSGISADKRPYMNMGYYKFRESFAVCKDFVGAIFKVKPKYMGEKIDITGDGKVTKG
ncbi:MAG TPA: hypothetical protein DCP90_06810 [Clostridiales bacterium]|nr:MAG: hypothetical protein A2Y22_01420 [Clostridiales bacterium GWD2_32_59]HAN10305.1 hypothetical protein [Clostridiales bacterium]